MSSFLGQSMTQDWIDLPIWEEFFNLYPIKTLIELGTGVGGMSTFLALQCVHRGAKFYTFDNQKFMNWESGVPKLLNLLNTFNFVDMWSPETNKTITNIIAPETAHPLAIFFDNGDKPQEWGLFAHKTWVGDYCIVHDWGAEFTQDNIGNVPVERILTKMCDARTSNWKSVWYKRI